jgi:hypothetical protein
MGRSTMSIVVVLALMLCAGFAAAQTTPGPDTFKVDYFSNANTTGAPDGTVKITNPGTSGGNLCAAIFVFDANEELSECCSCPVSVNDLRTLSVDKDLTGNPLTGTVLNTGLIEVVSTATVGGLCPLPTPGKVAPTASVRVWATHIQNSGWTITEQPSQDASFGSVEFTKLENFCYAVKLVGSNKGVCTCGTGD